MAIVLKEEPLRWVIAERWRIGPQRILPLFIVALFAAAAIAQSAELRKAVSDFAHEEPLFAALAGLSIVLALGMAVTQFFLAWRYPAVAVLDRATNRFFLRGMAGTAESAHTVSLHEITGFEAVDLVTATQEHLRESLERQRREGKASPWAARWLAMEEWAFRALGEAAQHEAEQRVFGKKKKMARLRIRLQDGRSPILHIDAPREQLEALIPRLRAFLGLRLRSEMPG